MKVDKISSTNFTNVKKKYVYRFISVNKAQKLEFINIYDSVKLLQVAHA